MRLIALSMVKSEGDIIESFVRHTLSFVDALYIIDNHSVDGTREILVALQREGLPVVIYDDPRPAYFQSEKMTVLYRDVCDYANPDFVFPLDADEFIRAQSRTTVESELAALPHGIHGLIPWKTYIFDVQSESQQAQANAVQRMTYRRRHENPQYEKVVVHADPIENARFILTQGNHSVIHTERGSETMRPLKCIALAHFPVRCESQVVTKAVCGWLAYLAKNPNAAASSDGYQWHDLYQRVVAGATFTANELGDISVRYAQLTDLSNPALACERVFDPVPAPFPLRYQTLWRPNPFLAVTQTAEDYFSGLQTDQALELLKSDKGVNGDVKLKPS